MTPEKRKAKLALEAEAVTTTNARIGYGGLKLGVWSGLPCQDAIRD